MLVRTETKVLHGLTRVLDATEKQGVLSSRGAEGKLVNSNSLTTSRGDASTGGRREAESGNGHLGDNQKAIVIGDSGNNNHNLFLVLIIPLNVGGNSGNGHGRSIHA